MGTPVEDSGQVQDNTPDQSDVPGPNPAWNDVLSVLPEQFHQVVTPHFQKWDQSAQSRIEAANNSLKEFEGFKPFVEHGINPQEVEQGLRLMWEINNNPENVYKALAEAYKFGQETPPVAKLNNDGDDDDDDTPYGIDPEIASKLEQQEGILQAVAQIVLNDAQAKEASKADSELETELAGLKQKYGEYDEDYVLTKMLNGASGEDAVKAYQSLVSNISQNRPFAPNVLGNSSGGTGLPSQAIDPTQLSGKETRNLVAQMLQAEFGKK
jgi:hypothetical protein